MPDSLQKVQNAMQDFKGKGTDQSVKLRAHTTLASNSRPSTPEAASREPNPIILYGNLPLLKKTP